MTPPPTTRMSSAPRSFSRLDEPRKDGHVRAREDADADDVDVLLDRRLDHLFRRAMETGVDDVHPSVPQRPRDDLDAAVVSVQPDLGDDHPNTLGWLLHATSSLLRRGDPAASP